ncbi:MAG TPA: serine/threonine-protein kinase [Myxococcales bacterium]|nr:serine/threonine-protein kinase [Myxococcales bacterium]
MGSTLVRDKRRGGGGAGRMPDVGDRLGAYQLVAKLGSGGMGTVFVGEQVTVGKRMALKVLHASYAQDAEVVGRLFREARAVNQVRHENIVEIFDFVQGADVAYLVMELLEGKDLGTALREEGPFPLARTLAIVRQIAEGVAAAHAKQIVHRDLKPENVILVHRGGKADFVKLLDFGLAKVLDEGQNPEVTRAGTILGTPEYMSPEQSIGEAVTFASDIYSLAILLHHLVTGKLPFEGASLGELRVARLQRSAPPLPLATPGGELVPERLRALVARCLALEPDRRCGSMREMLAELEAIAERPFEKSGPTEEPRPARRAKPAKSRRLPS